MRRSDGSTEWWPRHRPSPRRRKFSRAASLRWCSQTSIFSLQMHRPSPPQGACARHSRVARNGTSYIACRATTGQASHVENSTIQIDHVEGYTDLECWPIDARNRRKVLCACFSHAQTRSEITPYPKRLATVYVKQRAQLRVRACATDGSPIKMRNISIKTRARSGLPIHTTAENLCTCDLVTPKNASRDLFAVTIRCS